MKYLVLGSLGHQYVDCIEWDIGTLPNLVDYDVIIVNVRSLDGELLKQVTYERFKELRESLTRFLYSNGTLIILSDFFKVDRRPNKYTDSVRNYDWCPIIIDTIREQGTTIELINNTFPQYFSKFKKWEFYFDLPPECVTNELVNFVGNPNTMYRFPRKMLLRNRYGKMLSGIYNIAIYYKKKITHPYSTRVTYGYGQEPDKVFGEIILLPFIQELDYREALNLVLEDLLGEPQIPLPPAWVTKVKMPFIEDFDSKIAVKESEIEDIQKEIDNLQKQKEEIEAFKKLIYSDGADLEEVFRKCLQEMGGEVNPPKYSQEEFILVYKNKEYLVEAKGVSKSISLTHLRQLVDYLLKYEEETGIKCKGILFGNPWKNLPIEKRNTKGKPNFPSNVLERAKDWRISLVSSIDFFSVLCRFLKDRSLGPRILDAIINSNGLSKLSDFLEN